MDGYACDLDELANALLLRAWSAFVSLAASPSSFAQYLGLLGQGEHLDCGEVN